MPCRPCLAVAPEGSLADVTGAPGPAEAAESVALMPQNLDKTETALRDACLAAGVQYSKLHVIRTPSWGSRLDVLIASSLNQ